MNVEFEGLTWSWSTAVESMDFEVGPLGFQS